MWPSSAEWDEPGERDEGTRYEWIHAEGVRSREADQRGSELRGVRAEVTDSEGTEPRMSIQGCLSRHTHKQTDEQTNKGQENERKVRAIECRSGRAFEMVTDKTVVQRRARQAMECQNDQAIGQAIAQRHRHTE